MAALNTERKEALERLTAALSDALVLRRTIDDQILLGDLAGGTRDLMRQLRWLCKEELLNLKSLCHLFTNPKTFIGFHQQFHVLWKYSTKMLAKGTRFV